MTKIGPYEKLKIEYKSIIDTRIRINENKKFKLDIEIGYEGLFLYSVTLFENYLEEIFLGILKGEYLGIEGSGIGLSNEIMFTKGITDKKIKKYILGEKQGDYLNWFPFKDITVERANKFFIDGKPFTDLTDSQKQTLSEIIKLRNYIAHKSIESKGIVEKYCGFTILSTYHLLDKNHSGNEKYFDKYINQLNNISLSIQSNLN